MAYRDFQNIEDVLEQLTTVTASALHEVCAPHTLTELCEPHKLTDCLTSSPQTRLPLSMRCHPGGNPGANLKPISHRCYIRKVAFARELTKEIILLPTGCLQGGVRHYPQKPLTFTPYLQGTCLVRILNWILRSRGRESGPR